MSKSQDVTFIQKEVETFELKIELAIPPEKPQMRGYITVDAIPRTKEEVRALSKEDLSDEDYLRRIAVNIRGLEQTGDAAFVEVTTGKLSMWILPAIITAFFEQFGEARRKNALPQRGR